MAKTNKDKQVELAKDYVAHFNTERGKRVLHDMMKRFFVLNLSYCVGDTHETAFREGQRSVVMSIMDACQVDPDRFIRNVKERRNENERDDTHI